MRVLLLPIVAALTTAGAAPLAAQDYPASRVTVVVPSPAGSTTDALARLIVEYLGRKWGKPVIVENNTRGLNAGAEQVARAQPDGYTLLVSAPLPLTIADLLYKAQRQVLAGKVQWRWSSNKKACYIKVTMPFNVGVDRNSGQPTGSFEIRAGYDSNLVETMYRIASPGSDGD